MTVAVEVGPTLLFKLQAPSDDAPYHEEYPVAPCTRGHDYSPGLAVCSPPAELAMPPGQANLVSIRGPFLSALGRTPSLG